MLSEEELTLKPTKLKIIKQIKKTKRYQKGAASFSPELIIAFNQVHKFGTLVEAARSLTSCRTISEVISLVVLKALEAVEAADSAIFYLYDEQSGLLTVQNAIGFDAAVYQMKTRPGEIMSGKAFASGQASIYHTEAEGRVAGSNISGSNSTVFDKAAGGRFPKSAIIAPLKLQGTPIGVIVLDNFTKEYAFNNTDLAILQLWANHAAVALDNTRLYENQKKLVQNLEQNLLIHQSLTKTVLEGRGIDGITATLGDLLDNPVLVYDSTFEIQAVSHSRLSTEVKNKLKQWLIQNSTDQRFNRSTAIFVPANETGLPTNCLVSLVNVAGAILGWVVALAELKPFEEVEPLALEYATTIFGLEYTKQQAIFELEVRSKSDIIDDILARHLPVSLEQRLEQYGLSLKQPFTCLYIDVDNFAVYIEKNNLSEAEVQTIKSQLYQKLDFLVKQISPTVFICPKSDALITFINVNTHYDPNKWQAKIYGVVSALHNWLNEFYQGLSLSSAISGFYTETSALHTALVETQKVTKLYQRLGRTNSISFVEELGADQILLELPNSPKSLAFAERTLKPLVDYDQANHTELLKTLSIYCDNNRNISDTARALATHSNTTRYRVERIISLLSANLKDSKGWFDVELAIRIFRLHGKLS